jgi:protease I
MVRFGAVSGAFLPQRARHGACTHGSTMNRLKGSRVAVLAAEGSEEADVLGPAKALRGVGVSIDVVAPEADEVRAWNKQGWGAQLAVDCRMSEALAADYDGLVIAGGVMGADCLRAHDAAVDFVQAFVDQKKPVLVFGHGLWLLADAGVLRGRRVTGARTLANDLLNMGAHWLDEAVVLDRLLLTTQLRGDSQALVEKALLLFAEAQSRMPVLSATEALGWGSEQAPWAGSTS